MMAKRFRAKKKHKVKFKVIFLVILFVVTFVTTFKLIQKIKIGSSQEDLIRVMLEDTNHHIKTSKKDKLIQNVGNFLFDFNVKEPLSLLSSSLLYQSPRVEKTGVLISNNKIKDETDRAVDPNPIDITKPKVYLYNTHQTEEYVLENGEIHNITPNVMLASYIFKEKLNSLEIPTIVEERSVPDYLNKEGWPYYKSYQVSKIYLKDTIDKYPTLNYFIDIHRDGIKKGPSTTQIDGKSYAKVLFVVGLDNPKYQYNLDFANKINDVIKLKYPSLTRGVTTKKGDDVNGIYNQDVHGNILLIECGGYENTIDEINNTLNLLAPIFKEVIS